MKKITLFLLVATATLFTSLEAKTRDVKQIDIEKYKNILNQAEKLYSSDEIDAAIDRMAGEITDELSDKNPIFLCVLNGSIVPMGKIIPKLDFPLQTDYIRATRYSGKINGNNLRILAEPESSFKDRYVVIVEDIVDTGKTIKGVVDYCYGLGAKKVYTATMIDKSENRHEEGLQEVDFVGLNIPNKFIIGYGLDYEEYFRNLDGIYVMPLNELF